jgi:hypothetical protein
MTLANQSGWFVLAPHGAIAEWNGGIAASDLKVQVENPPPTVHAVSQVGSGILTWTIPYIFRTPPRWNLLCRGPANHVKDGLCPLEGLVEADWSFASFSMNWKLTRPGRVEFQAGEPVAMLVPQRRGELESFTASRKNLSSNPQLSEGDTMWIRSRLAFLQAQCTGDRDAIKKKYQRDYFLGRTIDGVAFEGHQKKRQVLNFEGEDSPSPSTPPKNISRPHIRIQPSGPTNSNSSHPSEA